ncbi:MAG TPA: hypothetical protein VFQ38_05900 [Longimicrobiales bacterium]|nr:hypothetical protein [Longimicrobiales bacterium]
MMQGPPAPPSGLGLTRALGLLVLALMLVAVVYSAWIGVRYFGHIGV